jgi:Zn-dependent peptidase ImmA (M78 family)
MWAQKRAGLSADKLRNKFPQYDGWINGMAQPTMRQLENFSTITRTPLGYFFLSVPPEEPLPIPDFRTLTDTTPRRPSPELLDTIGLLQRRQEWLREYLIEEGAEALPFIGTLAKDTPPKHAARKIREHLGLDAKWAAGENSWEDALRLLRRKIEDAGVHITINGVVGNNSHRKLDVTEFRGFALCDHYAPFIFINNADAKSAQMFTLAHEFVHLWHGDGGLFGDVTKHSSDVVERQCNETAAEFLVPQDALSAAWKSAQDKNEPFRALAAEFKVSPIVIARRALDAGLVDKKYFFAFYEDYMTSWRLTESRRKERSGGGNFWLNQSIRLGENFMTAVVHAARSGKLLYRDAYQLTGFSGVTFDRFVEKTLNPLILQ